MKRMLTAAAISGLLILAACGGGGGGSGLSGDELNRIRSDPRVVRATGIAERADSLLIPSLHAHITVTASGQTYRESLTERFGCSGTRCSGDRGTIVTVADIVDPNTDLVVEEATLGARGGFDTATVRGHLDFSTDFEGQRITIDLSTVGYGFWGEHGYAEASILNGPISGRIDGVSLGGSLRGAIAAVLGDASDSNPRGFGGATWTGVAEAASVNTFQRRQGTATITIPDLERPRVSAAIRIGGTSIGSSRWTDMPLYSGTYGTGIRGRDYLQGKFHGPAHSETYGIFETGAYVGAFGAKRQ